MTTENDPAEALRALGFRASAEAIRALITRATTASLPRGNPGVHGVGSHDGARALALSRQQRVGPGPEGAAVRDGDAEQLGDDDHRQRMGHAPTRSKRSASAVGMEAGMRETFDRLAEILPALASG